MYSSLLLAVLLTLQADAKLTEGVYSLCEEVQGYSGEVLELKDGKFRYWFYSDVVTGDEPSYPLSGPYRVSGTTLILDNDKIHRKERTIAVVNGVNVLWRADGLKAWTSDRRVHPYAVLLQVPGATDGAKIKERPSMKLLYTKEMEDREKKEYEERYNDQPAEVRVLLRARSMDGDPNMDTYKKEIGRARVQPDPKLVAQLVVLMAQGSRNSIDARSILSDLYQESWLIKEAPPFMAEAAERKKALGTLIDALGSAPDRSALEKTVMVFLRASKVGKIDLAIPETGHRIKLEAFPNDGGVYGCEGTSVDDIYWLQSISKIIPVCQKWMREQLAK